MPRVTRRHHAEQLEWWAASGWMLDIEEGGGLWLHTAKEKTRSGSISWGALATPEEVATPELARCFLTARPWSELRFIP